MSERRMVKPKTRWGWDGSTLARHLLNAGRLPYLVVHVDRTHRCQSFQHRLAPPPPLPPKKKGGPPPPVFVGRREGLGWGGGEGVYYSSSRK